MNRKQKIIVSITGIFIVLLALVGLTYGYYITRITGNSKSKSISITTADDLKLTYDDGTEGVVGEEKIYPSNKEYTKTFTIKNEGKSNGDYGIYLIDVINTFERKDDIKYIMSCTTDGTLPCGEVVEETTFPSGISQLSTATIEPNKTHTYTFKFTYLDTGTDQSVDMGKKLEAKIQIYGKNNKNLIIPYETDTLAYNILNNASNERNEISLILDGSVESKVANEPSSSDNVKINPKKYPQILTNATNYYIAYACDYTIDGDYLVLGTEDCPVTITDVKYINNEEMRNNLKGKFAIWGTSTSINTSGISKLNKITEYDEGFTDTAFKYFSFWSWNSVEKIIATTEDDYGTSYYYRGGVENNYVNFAGMCWRIVRIQGDGSTKLILEDKDELCNPLMDADWKIKTGNYGYNSIESSVPNKYFNLANYLNPSEESSANAMSTVFKNFQLNELKNHLSYLKSGDWCLGDTTPYIKTNGEYTPINEEEKMNILNNGTFYEEYNEWYFEKEIYYDSYVRLYGNTTKTPTLKCTGNMLNNWADKTPMYVGTLTADEVVYAGTSTSTPNYNYYLLNPNYNTIYSIPTLSLSQLHYYGNDTVLNLTYEGYLLTYYTDVNIDMDLRPSVILKPGVNLSVGDGTIEKPYEVK